MSTRPAVLTAVQRMLWSESMGHCMNPGCQMDLFRNGVFLGEIAHIEENAAGGSVSYENLLILCRNCHKEIDAQRTATTEQVLLKWKANRNDEIRQQFTQAFGSFKELKLHVVPILRRNLAIFRSYGPGDSDRDYSARYSLWLKFEGELIANNQKLVAMLEKNEHLLHQSNRKIVEDFISHTQEFISTRGDQLTRRINLFPRELNSIFGIEQIDGSLVESISALQNLIGHLIARKSFVSLELTPNMVLTYRKGGRREQLNLSDRPRVQQVYWNGHFYHPQTTDVRYRSLEFILGWLYERNFQYDWPDPTRLTEIVVAGKYNVRFAYKYSLSEIDLYEIANQKNLLIVNLHAWGDNIADKQAIAKVSDTGLHVLRQSEFFQFAYEHLI